MFTTILLVCHLANPNDCVLLKDNRGPYETKLECVERAYEMIWDLNNSPAPVKPVAFSCERGKST